MSELGRLLSQKPTAKLKNMLAEMRGVQGIVEGEIEQYSMPRLKAVGE